MSCILLSCSICGRSYGSNREFKAHKKVHHPKISNFQVSPSIFDIQKSPERNVNKTSHEIIDLVDDNDQNDRKNQEAKSSQFKDKEVISRPGPKSSKKLTSMVPKSKVILRGPLSKKSNDLKKVQNLQGSNSKSLKLEMLENPVPDLTHLKSQISEFYRNSDKQSTDTETTDSDFDENHRLSNSARKKRSRRQELLSVSKK